MEKEIEECVICDENKISTNMYCYKCNKHICLDCCIKLSSRTSLLFIEKKQIFIKYQCPFCRYINNKNIRLFNKNEIISLYIDNLSQILVSQKNNLLLVNMYNIIHEENNKLKDELINKNKYINDIIKKSKIKD